MSPVDQSRPLARAYTGRRGKTENDESAWMVHIDPEMPCVIASNMSITSGPRTSPTMIRRGVSRFDRPRQIGQHDRTGTFGVRLAFHQREDVVVAARVPVEVQFGFLFEHDDALVGVELVSERRNNVVFPAP